jgi:hypothetical protein
MFMNFVQASFEFVPIPFTSRYIVAGCAIHL